jgi:putative ABC transport system substrate-binding protein
MKRRDLLLLAAASLASGASRAQQTERVRRIGYLTSAAPDDPATVLQTRALMEGLRELGWVEGRDFTIEHRFSGGGVERIRANAKELVALNPDIVVSTGGQQLAALLEQTRTTPIVFTQVADPVASGLVASLGRPGGNATGIGVYEAPLAGKWVELLKEIAPGIARALVIMAAEAQPQQVLADAVAAAARSVGLPVIVASVREPADYEREMAAFAREPDGGVVALSNPILGSHYGRVHALAMQYRLPTVYSYPLYGRTGGLVSYGPDTIALFHEVARYVDKILRGAKPGDLPVQLPTRFVLAVNLKTAEAIGLTVPQSILARADEVIE